MFFSSMTWNIGDWPAIGTQIRPVCWRFHWAEKQDVPMPRFALDWEDPLQELNFPKTGHNCIFSGQYPFYKSQYFWQHFPTSISRG